MQTRSSPWPVGALVLAGVTVGVVVTRWSSTPTGVAPAATAASPAPTADELTALRREIEQLSRDVREQLAAASAGSAARSPAKSDDPDLARLATAIERCNELLSERASDPNSSAGRARAAWAASQGEGYPSLEALRQEVVDAHDNDVDGRYEAALSTAKKKHVLWSREDVIARYGSPAQATAGEHALSLTYPAADDARQSCTLNFVLMQGVVLDVRLDCRDKN